MKNKKRVNPKIKKYLFSENAAKEALQRTVLLILLLCVLIFFIISFAFADDFGIQGATFPILEPDFLRVLQARVMQLQRLGYFQKLQYALQWQAYQEMNQPQSVPGITTTRVPRAWFYDPSILMSQNIYSPRGTLIVKAGEKYNPLQDVNLDEVLLFYNAEDPKQVVWAQRMNQKYHGHDQLILIKGSVAQQRQQWKQEKQEKQPIYFDQGGELTTRFHIRHVPALVKQQGLRLQIQEVLP